MHWSNGIVYFCINTLPWLIYFSKRIFDKIFVTVMYHIESCLYLQPYWCVITYHMQGDKREPWIFVLNTLREQKDLSTFTALITWGKCVRMVVVITLYIINWAHYHFLLAIVLFGFLSYFFYILWTNHHIIIDFAWIVSIYLQINF